MSTRNWPASTLPLPQVEPHSHSPDPAVVRTQMESGRFRQRRRFEASTDIHSVEWVFDHSQMAAFEAFVRHGLKGGSLWFNMELRLADGVKEYEVRLVNGQYEVSHGGGKWRVSGSIEIDKPALTDNWQLTWDYVARVEEDGGEAESFEEVHRFYVQFNQ